MGEVLREIAMFTTKIYDTYTLVTFEIPNGVITPAELAQITPPTVNPQKGVILSGRGPVWLFATLCHYYHPTAWVGCFDPRLAGAVVTQTHCPGINVGQIIPVPVS